MIANNIFTTIAEFCQNVLFKPFKIISSSDNWWLQNTISWIFIAITFFAFFYWMGELKKYKKAGNE